jgi:hypothetical protein
MTQLTTAKSRTVARTEASVCYRGEVANDEWENLAITVGGGDENGGSWGRTGQPSNRRFLATALSGSATSVGVQGTAATQFSSWSGADIVGGKVRAYRVSNGVLQLVRTADITGANVDYWSTIGSDNIITGTSIEFRLDNFNARKTYTFGVARINAQGQIGPVSSVNLAVTDAGYTTLTPATPTTGGTRPAITGRTGSLSAVTGLTAQIRASTTHNIVLSWTGAAPNEYVVFINWDGAGDRLSSECTLQFSSGPAIQTGDLLIFEGALILALDNNWISARVKTTGLSDSYGPDRMNFGFSGNVPGGRTWQYVAYDVGFPKPDITYPNHYLKMNGTASLPAQAECFAFSGTDQSFYDILVPGRTYRAEFVVAADAPVNAQFSIGSGILSAQTVSLTTAPQTFTFDFTVASIIKSNAAISWLFRAQTNNISLRFLSVRLWDTSVPYNRLLEPPPIGCDMRDHHMIKAFPAPSLDVITSRPGYDSGGWALVSLLFNCREYDCNPHFQIEWIYEDQFYYDLTTFLFAPAASGEPLALKREAMGYGPVHLEFARYLYEDGNERWNPIMWLMFGGATDSVTGATYTNGDLCALFSARRRSIMMSNPYWPTANPPREFVGGWLINNGFTIDSALYDGAEYASVALYAAGTDVNSILLSDIAARWREMLNIAQYFHEGILSTVRTALEPTGRKLAVYEAGPGYQLNNLNGATVTRLDEVVQETMCKSVGGTTAVVASVATAATNGFGPYNFFAWGQGGYWQAARRPSEGGGLYRVAAYLKAIQELLGVCRVYATDKFIDRQQQLAVLNAQGDFVRNQDVSRAEVFHFESITYPGRVGILYVNSAINFDAFGVGHPDYQAGVTGAADFRYHTRLPASATPWKVLRNEGNFRHHDAYKVGFRANVVGGTTIDGYVADPLCVDLTVTPEDFTVSDPTLRELTLLGGNCRLEIFTV